MTYMKSEDGYDIINTLLMNEHVQMQEWKDHSDSSLKVCLVLNKLDVKLVKIPLCWSHPYTLRSEVPEYLNNSSSLCMHNSEPMAVVLMTVCVFLSP